MTIGEKLLLCALLLNVTAALIAVWLGRRVNAKVDHSISLTNSRMTQLLKAVRKSSSAVGFARGRRERNRAAAGSKRKTRKVAKTRTS